MTIGVAKSSDEDFLASGSISMASIGEDPSKDHHYATAPHQDQEFLDAGPTGAVDRETATTSTYGFGPEADVQPDENQNGALSLSSGATVSSFLASTSAGEPQCADSAYTSNTCGPRTDECFSVCGVPPDGGGQLDRFAGWCEACVGTVKNRKVAGACCRRDGKDTYDPDACRYSGITFKHTNYHECVAVPGCLAEAEVAISGRVTISYGPSAGSQGALKSRAFCAQAPNQQCRYLTAAQDFTTATSTTTGTGTSSTSFLPSCFKRNVGRKPDAVSGTKIAWCRQKCNALPGCNFFSYNHSPSVGGCFLFDACPDRYGAPYFDSSPFKTYECTPYQRCKDWEESGTLICPSGHRYDSSRDDVRCAGDICTQAADEHTCCVPLCNCGSVVANGVRTYYPWKPSKNANSPCTEANPTEANCRAFCCQTGCQEPAEADQEKFASGLMLNTIDWPVTTMSVAPSAAWSQNLACHTDYVRDSTKDNQNARCDPANSPLQLQGCNPAVCACSHGQPGGSCPQWATQRCEPGSCDTDSFYFYRGNYPTVNKPSSTRFTQFRQSSCWPRCTQAGVCQKVNGRHYLLKDSTEPWHSASTVPANFQDICCHAGCTIPAAAAQDSFASQNWEVETATMMPGATWSRNYECHVDYERDSTYDNANARCNPATSLAMELRGCVMAQCVCHHGSATAESECSVWGTEMCLDTSCDTANYYFYRPNFPMTTLPESTRKTSAFQQASCWPKCTQAGVCAQHNDVYYILRDSAESWGATRDAPADFRDICCHTGCKVPSAEDQEKFAAQNWNTETSTMLPADSWSRNYDCHVDFERDSAVDHANAQCWPSASERMKLRGCEVAPCVCSHGSHTAAVNCPAWGKEMCVANSCDEDNFYFFRPNWPVATPPSGTRYPPSFQQASCWPRCTQSGVCQKHEGVYYMLRDSTQPWGASKQVPSSFRDTCCHTGCKVPTAAAQKKFASQDWEFQTSTMMPAPSWSRNYDCHADYERDPAKESLNAKCDPGSHSEMQLQGCELSQCVCEHGSHVSMPECPVWGTQMCRIGFCDEQNYYFHRANYPVVAPPAGTRYDNSFQQASCWPRCTQTGVCAAENGLFYSLKDASEPWHSVATTPADFRSICCYTGCRQLAAAEKKRFALTEQEWVAIMIHPDMRAGGPGYQYGSCATEYEGSVTQNTGLATFICNLADTPIAIGNSCNHWKCKCTGGLRNQDFSTCPGYNVENCGKCYNAKYKPRVVDSIVSPTGKETQCWRYCEAITCSDFDDPATSTYFRPRLENLGSPHGLSGKRVEFCSDRTGTDANCRDSCCVQSCRKPSSTVVQNIFTVTPSWDELVQSPALYPGYDAWTTSSELSYTGPVTTTSTTSTTSTSSTTFTQYNRYHLDHDYHNYGDHNAGF
ncbi:unnamed protein product [Amoebophrya sp. A120]|nr:unnamed protein product [Amoebophrya sp. A120]|eukprot:GSA120T00021079001.1